MTPLELIGLIATIVAIWQACFAVIKACKVALNWSVKVQRFESEVTHLENAIKDVRALLRTTNTLPPTVMQNMKDATSTAKKAQVFIRTRIHGRSWRPAVLNAARMMKLKDDIALVRIRLTDSVGILNLALQTKSESQQTLARSPPLPMWPFERAPTFFPELFTQASVFNERSVVVARTGVKTTAVSGSFRYFLYYLETPRKWQKVVIYVSVTSASNRSAFGALQSFQDETTCSTLPSGLGRQLEKVLSESNLQDSVTRVSIGVTERSDGAIELDQTQRTILEDREEAVLCDNALTYDIKTLRLPWYDQGRVVLRCQRQTNSYLVCIGGSTYIEQRMPFAASSDPRRNGVDEFLKDLKLLYNLRDCKSVVRISGLVLDDTRERLKSYLYEWPSLGSMKRIFNFADDWQFDIPWPVRHAWAKQLVIAIADLHSRGIILGVLDLCSVCLKSDCTIVLSGIRTSGRTIRNKKGRMAPELRDDSRGFSVPQRHTFASDMFQLGCLIWLICEQTPNDVGTFCSRSPCTSFPRYACRADHRNPIGLMPCSRPDVPRHLNKIIQKCRERQPEARIGASQLLEYFKNVDQYPPELASLVGTFPQEDSADFTIDCDGCGRRATSLHYHCDFCSMGAFDICDECYVQGVHCLDTTHRLTKRIWKQGRIVTAP